MNKLSPNDVFKTQGQPTITYVKRENGRYEKQLSDAIDSKGIICVLTGPSKTGKTTLYTEVIRFKELEPLVIRCHDNLSANDVWKIALEKVNFERIRESSTTKEKTHRLEGKLGGKLGWSWLAGLVGEVKTGTSTKDEEAQIREKILANPQPSHLIPILKNIPYILVVEDFHYLTAPVQKTVFQQWKTFIDNEISVIVVGTTHHASDLAYANKDLIGRYTQIDLGNWEVEDLKKIPVKGFAYLEKNVPESVCSLIAKESVGLPIITQSVSLQIILNQKGCKTEVYTNQNGYNALHDVAIHRFGSFSSIHDRLIRGPRSRRKFNTYELVFSTFAQDPLKFALTRQEIDDRLAKLIKIGIEKSSVPPQGSVTSMLKAIGSFQHKLNIELLEWSERDQKLFILEPTFLFYLRWKEKRNKSPLIAELVNEIVEKIVGNINIKFNESFKKVLIKFSSDPCVSNVEKKEE